MHQFWRFIGKPLAALGGRSLQEMRDRSPEECDKSVAVGVLCLLSVGIIFVGQWLFWGNFAHVAELAVSVAASIALVFLVMYRLALRAMETMSGWAKILMLAMLGTLMGINAMLAGHELVLLAFKPQVEAQTALGAAQGVTAYASAVQSSLGLPQLRAQASELDTAIADARTERDHLPDAVQQLQEQSQSCNARQARLQRAMPAKAERPGYENAKRRLLEQRATCRKLSSDASYALAQHRQRADDELAELNRMRIALRQSLTSADSKSKQKVDQNAATVGAAATAGFARHTALWAAVDAGTVPAWAAYGLMAAVLLVDVFSFVYKLLARDDTITYDRLKQAGSDAVFNGLHAALVKQQRQLTRHVVKGMRQRTADELADLARNAVLPCVAQEVQAQAFKRTAEASEHARKRHGAPVSSMLDRLGRMGAWLREPFLKGTVARSSRSTGYTASVRG